MLAKTDPAPDFVVPQNGANVPWAVTMVDAFGNPIDIAGATVTLRWGPKNEVAPSTVGDGAVVGTSPQTQAEYVFTAGDLSTNPPGNYSAQFKAVKAGETFVWPPDRFATLTIEPQLP